MEVHQLEGPSRFLSLGRFEQRYRCLLFASLPRPLRDGERKTFLRVKRKDPGVGLLGYH